MRAIVDYYGLLEVGEGADAGEIKRAYHRLARRFHPDRTGGDAEASERFKAVHEAYCVLVDPERRLSFDRYRHRANGAGAAAADGKPGGIDLEAALDGPAFADLFDRAGGEPPESLGAVFARFTAGPPSRGKDVALQVRLSFGQALVGGPTTVRFPTGHALRLTVPRGARHGLKIRVSGLGGGGAPGGDAGDLYVTFRVEPDARFRREGDDLHVVEAVSALEAMVGATRAFTNAYGQTVKLPIPPGTQPGDRLRLRGQGVETAEDRGDLYVEVQVAVPRDLTDAQRAVLAAAARRCGLL